MGTKTLLVTGALSVAGVATSMAQVYSVNAVGYVNVTLQPGFNLIANPLNAADNRISAILASMPNQTTAYRLRPDGTYHPTLSYIGPPLNMWQGEAAVLADPLDPGEGFFIRNPTTSPATVTFVGEVLQGADSNMHVPAGFSLLGSKVPQAGSLTTDLEFPAANQDTFYQFDPSTQAYTATRSFIGAPLNIWQPSEPGIGVAEGFFVRMQAPVDWDRDFNINE